MQAMYAGGVSGAKRGAAIANRLAPKIRAAGSAFGPKGAGAAAAISRVLKVAGPVMGGAIGAFKARRRVGDDTAIGSIGGPSATIAVAGLGAAMNGVTMCDVQPMSHPSYGPGLRLTGRQMLAEVKGDGATTSIIEHVTGGASVYLTYQSGTTVLRGIFVNPCAFGGRLGTIAQTYAMFHFNVAAVDYVPAVGTAETGQLIVGYCRDPDVFPDINSFVELLQCDPTMSCPFYARGSTMYVDTDDKTFHIDASARGDGIMRWQSVAQGLFIFDTNGVVKAASTYGYIYLTYDLEVFFPLPFIQNIWPTSDAKLIVRALESIGYQKQFHESHQKWDVDLDVREDNLVISVHKTGALACRSAAQPILKR